MQKNPPDAKNPVGACHQEVDLAALEFQGLVGYCLEAYTFCFANVCILNFCMASVAHMRAIAAAVLDANHSCIEDKLKAIMLTSIAFKALVTKAGLSGPRSVGIIEGMKITWQIAITMSCHITAYDYI